MLGIPHKLTDAKSICSGLQHLVGKRFDKSLPHMGTIERVTVAPFGHEEKKQFMLYYLLCEDPEQALTEYQGFLFDIIVIARSLDDQNDLMHYDLPTWLRKNNINSGAVPASRF